MMDGFVRSGGWRVAGAAEGVVRGIHGVPIGSFAGVGKESMQNCSLILSANTQTFPVSGGGGTVTVTGAPGCAWTAASNETWITINSGSSGSGNGAVNFTVAANTGPERFGRITIAGRRFFLLQESNCAFALSSTEGSFGAGGGTGTLNVSTTSGCTWTGAPVALSTPELPRVYLNTAYTPPAGQTIAVPAGGDLQAAINQAKPGDVITLQAGATYTGRFTLPAKTGEGWIVIRTSAPDSSLPPPGTRITPSFANVLPKIVTPNVEPAIATLSGAHHYRFIGVEITAAQSAAFVYSLVNLGAEETSAAQLPNNLIFDRVYIHGRPSFTLRRGIQLNSASTAVIDSYISDCHEVGADSQAIGGWNGPGPFKIVNNYLEGAGENIIIGGADPTIPNLVPSDIEIRRNYCFKPLTWRIGDPSYAGTPWGVKNLFELKNAQRVLIDGNVFEHNWTMAQNGFAILFTVRNQDGTAPWSVVQDVTFTNNIVRRAAGGINLLGIDDNNPSLVSRRIRIANNLMEEIDGVRWEGGGIAFQLVSSPREITIENNTVLHSGNIIAAGDTPTDAFVFRNNLFPHNEYGIKGDSRDAGNETIGTYLPGALLRRNVMVGGEAAAYPADNFFPGTFDEVLFQNFAGRNYRLGAASPFKNAGTDGRDIGAEFDSLEAAMSASAAISPNFLSAPWITITSGASGAGAGAVGYSVAPNPGPARMGTMLIAGRTFTVVQDSGCAFSISPGSRNFGSGGGQGTVSVTASGAACSWQATSGFPWITVAAGVSNAGSGTVGFSIGANSGVPRSGTLIVAGQIFTVTQAGAVAYEADVAPRPNGGGTLMVTDWVQVGRFSVGLDTPAAGSEAQRADCAPRETLGDGRVTLADWVQAGRYTAGLDPVTVAGGPTELTAVLPSANRDRPEAPRDLRVGQATATKDRGFVTVPVELAARGTENGISLSLHFDPAVLSYQEVVRGRDAGRRAQLLVNPKQAGEGRLGFGLLLRAGEAHAAGPRELVRVKFRIVNPNAGSAEVRIADGPTPIDLVDGNAETLPVRVIHGAPHPGGAIATRSPTRPPTRPDHRSGPARRTAETRTLFLTNRDRGEREWAGCCFSTSHFR
ncbi:MAG: BACON domain-containing protein [Blastocatellia bacterium]